MDTIGQAAPRPQLFGDVGRDGGQQQQQRLDRLVPGRLIDAAFALRGQNGVAQLHDGRHGGVEGERLQILRHLADDLMRLASQSARGGSVLTGGVLRLANLPHVLQQPLRPLDAFVVPRPALVPLGEEHQVGAHRVGPELGHQFVRVDDVALALRHALHVQMVAQLVDGVVALDGRHADDGVRRDLDGEQLAAGVHLQHVLGAAHDLAHDYVVAQTGRHRPRLDDLHPRGGELVALAPAIGQNDVPLALRAQDLPLVAQAGHWLIELAGRVAAVVAHDTRRLIEQPQVAHDLGEEAGVEQVHRGVLLTAGVDVDRQPVGRLFGVERAAVVGGAEVAVLVPRRAHEGVHRVRLAAGRAAVGVGGVQEAVVIAQRALAGGPELYVVGQQHRQLRVGNHLNRAVGGKHGRNGRAPVALAADQPVAQAVVDRLRPAAALGQPVGHRANGRIGKALGRRHRRAVEQGAVDHHPRPNVGLGHRRPVQRLALRLDDRDDVQAVLAGEVEVALVVGGHGHDRSRAVGAQHVVGDPDGNTRAVDRVNGVAAGEDARLLARLRQALDLRRPRRLRPVGVHGRPLLVAGHFVNQVVLRGQHHERRPPQGIGPSGEDLNRVAALAGKDDARAFAAADPVRLHQPHRVGPVNRREVQQLVGVASDAEEPLLHHLLNDRLAGALVLAVDDLLVGQHRLQRLRPVDQPLAAIGQVVFEEAAEEPLRPLVVGRVATDRLALPVEHRPHAAQLAAHTLDVGVGPRLGVDVALDGGVLGRQTEGVEAHREQDVVAAHTHEARPRVGRGHGEPVADVEIAAGVGQHGQGVVLRPLPIDLSPIQPIRLPLLLPLRLDGRRIVDITHDSFSARKNIKVFSRPAECASSDARSTRRECASEDAHSALENKRTPFAQRRKGFRGTTLIDGTKVDLKGFEPLTSTMPLWRSPN